MPIRGGRLRWPPRLGKRSDNAAFSNAQRSSFNGAQPGDAKKQPVRQPNERHESADQGPPQTRESMHRAHDAVSGQHETDLPRSGD